MDTWDLANEPTHQQALDLWVRTSQEAKDTIGELAMLVLPNQGPTLLVAGLVPSPEFPLANCIASAVTGMIAAGHSTQPLTWIAVVAPAFAETVEAKDLSRDNDNLEQRYLAGDERVREVVCVSVLGADGVTRVQYYAQPLLEPIGGVGTEVVGNVSAALRWAKGLSMGHH